MLKLLPCLTAPAIQVHYPCEVLFEFPSDRRGWCKQLEVLLDEGALDAAGVSVACSGGALMRISDRKWTDAKAKIEKGNVLL